MACSFPQQSFGTIPLHRASYTPACRDSHTTNVHVVWKNDHNQQWVGPRSPLVVDPLYIETASESNSPLYHPALLGSAGYGIAHREPRARGLAFFPVSLLSLRFAYGQSLAALLPATLEDLLAALARPTRQEPVFALSLPLLRLVRSLWHILLPHQVRQRKRLSSGTKLDTNEDPQSRSHARICLAAWEPLSPADRRQLQNLITYYTVMGISGQISRSPGACRRF